MKFIDIFSSCLIILMTIWMAGMFFASGASFYSWIVLISLDVVYAYIIKLDISKYDK